MSLFPEGNGLNKNHDPGIWSTTPEFGSKRTPHLRSTVPNVQRHMAYFALGDSCLLSRPHCISFQSTALVFFDSHRHSPTLWDAHCPAGTDKSDRIVK
jgi:hypothetical protein